MASGNATDRDSVLAFGDIIQAYCERHRFYHTPEHLAALMDLVDPLPLIDPVSVKMAIFYHDYVYETDPQALQEMRQGQRASNEERSAQRAISAMTTLGFPADTIERTARMIRLTANHQLESQDSQDAAFFLDMDMSILGAQPQQYGLYVSQIFSEYAILGRQAVTKGRLDFIAATLQSPRIFHTDPFIFRYDAKARANLAREQGALQSGGGVVLLKKLSDGSGPSP